MSSKYGFETQDDKEKQRAERERLEREEREQKYQKATEIAAQIDNIVLDILLDFAKTEKWDGGIYRYGKIGWTFGNPDERRLGQKLDDVCPLIVEVGYDGYLEVHFPWYRVFAPPYDDRRKLCEVLRKMTNLPVKYYNVDGHKYLNPSEIFK